MAWPKFQSTEHFLEYHAEHSAILETLRRIVLSCSDHIREGIRYNTPFYDYKGMLLYISLNKKYVYIGFVHGISMSDEAGVFASNTLKQIRQIHYKSLRDIDEEVLRNYVFEAMLIQDEREKLKKKRG